MIINLRPNQQNTDTDIQPQHQQHNGRQAPVHVGEVAEEVGEDGPAGGAEEGAGDLVSKFLVDAGQVGVEGHEGHNQDGHGGHGAEADDEGNDFPNQRKQPVNQPLQRASQHQENQAANAGEDKDNGVSRADNPPHNIISLSGNLIYPVQTPLNAQHPPGG